MSDVFSKAKRSEVMSRIRSTGNRDTELRLVELMRAAGITGWRRGLKIKAVTNVELRMTSEGKPDHLWQKKPGAKIRSLPLRLCASARENGLCPKSRSDLRPFVVKPDFVFRKQRIAVFVDGCFWHGCPRHFTRPKSRRAFWDAKIAANRARDRAVNRALRAAGWRVIRIWEHCLTEKMQARTMARMRRAMAP